MPDSPRIVVYIARVETKIRRVEDRKESAFFHELADGRPLLACRIVTRRVVGTCVEDDDRAGRCFVEHGTVLVEIEAIAHRVVIAPRVALEAKGIENTVMVAPGWV